MIKRISVFGVVLIMGLSIGLFAPGCSKKQVIKEEATGKPVAEAKKEQPKPEIFKPLEKPKEMTPKASQALPAAKPKEEAKPEQKAASIDLAGLRIRFAFDDYSLSPRAKDNLEKIGAWMSKTPDAKILIQGNTCDIGTAEYNMALGDRRASSAKAYLQNLGINPNRISTISYGEERPLVPNMNEDNRSKNRRDDFSKGK